MRSRRGRSLRKATTASRVTGDTVGCTAPARDTQDNGTSRPPPSGLHRGPPPGPECRPSEGVWVPLEEKTKQTAQSHRDGPECHGPARTPHAHPGTSRVVSGTAGHHLDTAKAVLPLTRLQRVVGPTLRPGASVEDSAEVPGPVPPPALGGWDQGCFKTCPTPSQRPASPWRSAEAHASGPTALCVPRRVRQVADGHRTASRDPGPGPRLTWSWPCDLGPVSYPLRAQVLPLRIIYSEVSGKGEWCPEPHMMPGGPAGATSQRVARCQVAVLVT